MKKRPIALKESTIKLLDQIAKDKIKTAIKNKKFNINALVKNKRGITFDKEILFLARFYIKCQKNKKLRKILEGEKMNSIC